MRSGVWQGRPDLPARGFKLRQGGAGLHASLQDRAGLGFGYRRQAGHVVERLAGVVAGYLSIALDGTDIERLSAD